MLNLNNLPPEIHAHIVKKLSPQDTTRGLSAVSRKMNAFANDNHYWRDKLKNHFPHIYATLGNETGEIDFKELFKEHYKVEYRRLSKKHRDLFSFVKDGDIENLRELSIKKKDLLVKDKNGLNILDWARKNNYQTVLNHVFELVLVQTKKQNGFLDFNNADSQDMYLLHWAILCNQPTNIKKLLFSGANALVTSGNMRYQPIHLAAKKGQLDAVKALIENNPNVLNQTDARGKTSLIWVASKGHLSVVKYLVKREKVNLDAASHGSNTAEKNGRTALHCAAEHGHGKTVEALVKAGAIATLVTSGNMRYQPIHLAAKKGQLDAVKALIENNPDVLNQTDAHGQTPLIWAASKGHLAVVKYLVIQEDINLDATSHGSNTAEKNGRTALHCAAEHGHGKTVEALVKAGATATLVTSGNMQYQPIHLAAKKGHLNAVKALIENNPDVLNQTDARGKTPLMWAATKGHLAIVKYLVIQEDTNLDAASHGSNTAEKNGRTALHCAAEHGHEDTVKTLIKEGSSQLAHNGAEKTPAQVAKTDKIKALLSLDKYIEKREASIDYKASLFPIIGKHFFNESFTLFGQKFNYEKKEKVAAAKALRDHVLATGAGADSLKDHEGALNNGKLGKLYRCLR